MNKQVYHGSPYVFERFDISRVGTGEGHTTFGWGLYFTESEDVAKYYAEALGSVLIFRNRPVSKFSLETIKLPSDISISEDREHQTFLRRIASLRRELSRLLDRADAGVPIDRDRERMLRSSLEKTYMQAANIHRKHRWQAVAREFDIDVEDVPILEKIIKELNRSGLVKQCADVPAIRQWLGNTERLPLRDRLDMLRFLNKYKDDIMICSKQVYKVALHGGKQPRDFVWLDWDAVLPREIRTLIILQAQIESIPGVVDYLQKYPESKGAHIYTEICDAMAVKHPGEPSDKLASLFLLRAGIDGIRYHAGRKFYKGGSSYYNYVVFDDEYVSIIERQTYHQRRELPGFETYIKVWDAVDAVHRLVEIYKNPPRSTFLALLKGDISGYVTNAVRALVTPACDILMWGSLEALHMDVIDLFDSEAIKESIPVEITRDGAVFISTTIRHVLPQYDLEEKMRRAVITLRRCQDRIAKYVQGPFAIHAYDEIPEDVVDLAVMQQNLKASVEFVEDGRALIRALKNPDVSSPLHELWHIFRRDLPEQDRKIVEHWLGVQDGIWTTEAEEKWARAGEKYLMEGVPPTEELKLVFRRYRDWLSKIYRNALDMDIDIPPQVRTVMQRLFQPAFQAYQGKYTGQVYHGAIWIDQPFTRPDPRYGTYGVFWVTDSERIAEYYASAEFLGEQGTYIVIKGKIFLDNPYWYGVTQDDRVDEYADSWTMYEQMRNAGYDGMITLGEYPDGSSDIAVFKRDCFYPVQVKMKRPGDKQWSDWIPAQEAIAGFQKKRAHVINQGITTVDWKWSD